MTTNPENFRPQSTAGSQQYIDSAIRMASPARLRLMVLDRSVQVAATLAGQWREGTNLGTNETSLTLLELLGELLSGVSGSQVQNESELCNQVADLYVFLTKHLVLAEENSDADAIDDIRLVLEVEAETWRAVCARDTSATTQAIQSPITPTGGGLNFSA